MKSWLKSGLIGAGIGFLLSVAYYIFPSYSLFRLSLPISFLYPAITSLLVKLNFTLVQTPLIYYLIALLTEGFIIGIIIHFIKNYYNPSLNKDRGKR